jgi:hypothetical protein
MKESTRHGVLWLGLVLVGPFAGVYLLNETVYRPPPRPSPVPEDAVPFRQGEASLWWWSSCREVGPAEYNCRLFDERGQLAVAGRYAAQPRTYTDDDGGERSGHCRANAATRRFGQYSAGEIYAQPGCVLVPRHWVYFPSRRTKAAVSADGAGISLAREVAMTDEELIASAE